MTGPPTDPSGPLQPTTELRERLTVRLGELVGTPVTVDQLHQLPAGASRHTWSFDATDRDGRTTGMILRCDPPGLARPETMAREAHALHAARDAGVPEPTVYDHGDGHGLISAPYLLVERLDGETIPRRLLRDERFAGIRPRLARELGGILARIHTIPLDSVPGLTGSDPVQRLVELYEHFDEPRPPLEIGLRWLAENRPAGTAERLVHGDFRTGNLLIGPDGVRGVLDWELVHRGDPAEDLGWLCVKAWRFGSPAPVGGFGPREDLLEGYAEIAGTTPDPSRLFWWEVYGTVRWALLCRSQAERHLSGAEPSIELAALGRRVCEQEHDTLLALGLTEPRDIPDPLDTAQTREPADEPHDRPGPREIADAVSGFLTADVASGTNERLRFHSRVAANVLRIAQRQMLLAEQHRAAHRQRITALGCTDDRELAQAIRDGTLDNRWSDVVAAVRDTVTDKLTVANPAYLAQPG